MAGNSSRWKLPFIRETLIKDPSRPPVLALAVTETWFVPTLSEAQVELENYHCFRSDRAGRSVSLATRSQLKTASTIWSLFTLRVFIP